MRHFLYTENAEKTRMREKGAVQKPCVLPVQVSKSLCATAWFFFPPMRDQRETTVVRLIRTPDYIYINKFA